MNRAVIIRKDSMIALAVMLALTSAPGSLAQSADILLPGPIDLDSRLPLGDTAPRTLVAMMRSDARVHSFEVTVESERRSGEANVADGRSATTLTVRLLDASGASINAGKRIRYSLSGADPDSGEVLLKEGVAKIRFVAPSGARDVLWSVSAEGVTQQGKVDYVAELRSMIAAGLVEAVIDLDRRQSGGIGRMAGLSDGLERELRNWEHRFNNGKSSLAGRASVFVKGTLQGDTSITAMFDSEKDLRQREFSDYNPDRVYPVMGDSAERGIETRTSDRLYLRLDKERDYILYGDFATGSEFSIAQGGGRLAPLRTVDLGQYNRSMTGLRARRDDGVGYVDGFAMRDSLRQAVEEYRGNGTSGPFAVGNYNALDNSEKIEVVVRDRNNTSRIVAIRALERYTDYTFEPFSGRVLLKEALSAVDAELNPVSLRITYEVDTGGEEFWVYGFNAQRKFEEGVTLGLSMVRDENPNAPVGGGYSTTPGTGFSQLRELDSVNASIGDEQRMGVLVLEGARSVAASVRGELEGAALRFDWRHGDIDDRVPAGNRWNLRLYGGSADKEFVNPASSLAAGRSELGAQAARELGDRQRVHLNGSYTADSLTGGERGALSVGLEHDLSDRFQLEAGVRHFYQRGGGVASLSPLPGALVMPNQGSAFGGAGLNPNGAGFWGMGVGLDPITGQPQSAFTGSPLNSSLRAKDLDVTTYMLGMRARMSDSWALGGEIGLDDGFEHDPLWFAINSDYRFLKGRSFARLEAPTGRATAGADYKLSETMALYGRWEETNGLGSVYSIDAASRSQAVVFGLRRFDEEGSELHSELRLRDGMNAQEVEAATGLRNTIALSDSVNANFLFERLEILEGIARSATALGGGLEFGDRTWQGTSRLEWRHLDRADDTIIDNTADSVMGSFSLARKLSGEWTGLLRNYALITDDRSRPGSQMQNRFQIGAAYRPRFATQFDLLLRYEQKREYNNELAQRESRDVNIVSTHFNWHPNRQLWISGRLAAKDLDETFGGVRDEYQAWLVSTRVIHDLGERFDISAAAGVMGTPDSDAREEVYGLEVGYRVKENVWLSAGHNFAGFSDRDLAGREQTEQGWYLRLRMKFDEKLLQKLAD